MTTREIAGLLKLQGVGGQVIRAIDLGSMTSEQKDIWAKIHRQRTAMLLDNDPENIRKRLDGSGSVIYVVANDDSGDVSAFERKILRYGEMPLVTQESLSGAQLDAANRVHGTGTRQPSRTAQAIVRNDYNGNLGGGSPKNPLRINTKSPKNTAQKGK